jgi:hypothetical protein
MSSRRQNILIVVPGFGECDDNRDVFQCTITKKIEILRSNLDFFLSNPYFSSKDRHLVVILQYNRYDSIFLDSKYNIKVILDDISLNSFLYDYITPEFTEVFDYIVLLLDDVEIEHTVSFLEVLDAYDKSGLDIISPRVNGDTHNFIRPKSEYYCNISTFKILEIFCYLMDHKGYTKYYNILVPWNEYMWGYDLVLGYKDILCGTYNLWNATHHCPGETIRRKENIWMNT